MNNFIAKKLAEFTEYFDWDKDSEQVNEYRKDLQESYQQGRKEGIEEVVRAVTKSKQENEESLCKNTNCADPICGHNRCIDWMYDRLEEIIKEIK